MTAPANATAPVSAPHSDRRPLGTVGGGAGRSDPLPAWHSSGVNDYRADYRAVNRANWDDRVPVHVASQFYAVDQLAADPSALSPVVCFDAPRLGDIKDARAVHLQCHIGTDTISLARLGARVTGLDFSGAAITEARRLAARAGVEAEFVQAEVYDAVDALGAGRFDLVYTGVGALCWLPDIRRWAGVVAALLAPGGRLFVRDGHPMLSAIDEQHDNRLVVDYPYFETREPLVFEIPTTYTDGEAHLDHALAHSWNHGLGETVTALLDEGLTLTQLVEHDTAPWDALPGQTTRDGDEWRLAERPERLPLTFTLQAVKRT